MSDALLTQLLAQRREMYQEVVDVDEPIQQLLIIGIGEQKFAIFGHYLREILSDPDVCWVPGCPDSIEGVINLRGRIESVIRLHERLRTGMPSTELSAGFVLIAETEEIRTGIRIEALIDMIEISESELQPPPSSLPIHLQPYVSHVMTYQQQPLAVLNIQRLLADYAKELA